MRIFFISIIFLHIFISCQFNTLELNKEIRELKSKPLLIDYPLKFYSISKGWFNNTPLKKFKIVTCIDARCSTCLNELGLWNEYIEDNQDFNVDYLFFLKIDDFKKVEYFLKHIDFKYPVIIDENNTFFNQNSLPKDKTLHTFLIDRTNNILLVGNPAKIPSLNKLFRNFLNNPDN